MEEMVCGFVTISCALLLITLGWRVLDWVWLKPRKMEKYLKHQGIPGPSYRFLYGNMKEIVNLMRVARSKPMELSHRIVPRILPFYQQAAQEYGKIFVTWNGPTPRIVVLDPELIREILANKYGQIGKIKGTPLGKLLIQGVVAYEGEKWVKHRRIVNPAFHLQKLKLMLPEFLTSCNELVRRWHEEVLESSTEVDVWPYLQNLTADVISRAAFGSSYEEGRRIFQLQIEQAELVMQVARSLYIPGFWFLPTKRNNRMKKIHREVETLLKDVINKRENAMKAGEASKDDLLGILLESNYKEIEEGGNTKNAGMSLHEVIEECKLFYFAGQETTSTLILWTMITLSMHQEWQKKAREEVLKVFGRNAPDFEGLNQLKTVTMILHEVLRLYPSAILLTRATCKEMNLGKAFLPPKVEFLLPILMVHHDPELWGKDVEEFNPERFSGGISNATDNQASFLPFGGGPRICIGQAFALTEAKMALSMILQNFAFELSPSYRHAPYTVLTLQPQYGAQLMLHKL